MLDTSYLYDPIRNRYKGVYPSSKIKGSWEALVTSPEGKLSYIGKSCSQEDCAQVVAAYYCNVYGPDWPELLEDRKKRYWRIRRMNRTAHLTVYIAEVRVPGYVGGLIRRPERSAAWHQVMDADISCLPASTPSYKDTSVPGWCWAGKGWQSAGAALVAIRTYRFIHQDEQPQPSSGPDRHSSVVATSPR